MYCFSTEISATLLAIGFKWQCQTWLRSERNNGRKLIDLNADENFCGQFVNGQFFRADELADT